MGAAGFTPGGFPFGGDPPSWSESARCRGPSKPLSLERSAQRRRKVWEASASAGEIVNRAVLDTENGSGRARGLSLGKLTQMPYVWLPRRDFFTSRGRRCRPATPNGTTARQNGGSFLTPEKSRLGRIAQLVEQLTLNQRVQGSSPCAPTNHPKGLARRSPADPAGNRAREPARGRGRKSHTG